jgi:hypothetical protein
MIRKNLFGGYPYVEPKSLEVFPAINRASFSGIGGHVTNPKLGNQELTEQFIISYNKALDTAEQQILDLQAEYPFIPNDFGFNETEEKMGDDSGFMPTCYKKGKYLLARIPGTDNDWFISGIGKVFIPNTEWAYIIFRSLGIITEEEVAEEVIISGETIKDIEN